MTHDDAVITGYAKVGIYRTEQWLATQLDSGVRPDDPQLFDTAEFEV